MADNQLADNAETKLTTAVNNSDDPVTFSVTAGDGAKFPSYTGSQLSEGLVLVDASGNYEKLRITARSSDSITAVRAQGGTTKKAFAIGDAVYLAHTKEVLELFLQTQDVQTGKPHWCGTAGGTAYSDSAVRRACRRRQSCRRPARRCGRPRGSWRSGGRSAASSGP